MAEAADDVRALLKCGVPLDRILSLRPHNLEESHIRELAKEWFTSSDGGSSGPGHSLDVAEAVLERSRSALNSPAFREKFIEGLEGDAPEELKDPLFFTLLKEPVVLSSGIVLDRSSALNERGELRFRQCPFTRTPLKREVYPLLFLKEKLVDFVKTRLEQIFKLVDTAMQFGAAEGESSNTADQDVETASRALEIGRNFLQQIGRHTYLHEAERMHVLRLKVFRALQQCEPAQWEEAYEDLCRVRLQLGQGHTEQGLETLLSAVADMQGRSTDCLADSPPDCAHARLWLQSACGLAVRLRRRPEEQGTTGTLTLPPSVSLELARLFLRIAKADRHGQDAPGARVAVYLALQRSGASEDETRAFLASERTAASAIDQLFEPSSEFTVDIVSDVSSEDAFTRLGRLECGAGRVVAVTAKCLWKDQGWGNKKGKVRVRLMRGEETVATKDLFGICGEVGDRGVLEPVEITLTPEDHIVATAHPGDFLCFEYQVGGGGGHRLYIRDFKAQLTWHNPAPAEGEADAAIELPPPWIHELLGSSAEEDIPEVEYEDSDGDAIRFVIEDGRLIKYVNGTKVVGRGDNNGVVTRLQWSPLTHISDQHGWGGYAPEASVHKLRRLADRLGIQHNIPVHLPRGGFNSRDWNSNEEGSDGTEFSSS